jgi:alpha,alpha-trehalase
VPLSVGAPSEARVSRQAATSALCRILDDLDADCDRRVTIEDDHSKTCTHAGEKSATSPRWPYDARVGDTLVSLREPHEAAQLVQELVLALRASGGGDIRIDFERARLDPASYLADRIERHFWDALTRRIDSDPERLFRAASDEKLGDRMLHEPDPCPAHEAHCASCLTPRSSRIASGGARETFVYYPPSDPQARVVFEHAGIPGRLAVAALPERVTARWLSELTRTGRHGLLTLALDSSGAGRPFVVPGGRFNEMYGWDSFFIAWGLVQDPARAELARSIADNQAYEIDHYGKILNANRTYYLTRSQPPFLTSLISKVWRSLPDTADNRAWLERSLRAAIREYRTVWTSKPRRLGVCDGDVCLARYSGEGFGEPPEVELGHFDWFYQTHAIPHGHCRAPAADDESRTRFVECAARFADGYRNGSVTDREVDDFFENDRCVRESGHDTTFRWFRDGRERCVDFATVDLNSLLFKYEVDIATLLTKFLGGALGNESADAFCARARARARLVTNYLWDVDAGLFYDYDIARRRRSRYLAATTLYPLWASQPNACGATIVTPPMAKALVTNALDALEAPGGLLAASPASAASVRRPTVTRRATGGGFETFEPGRQWEAPNGWAPHQMLAWEGLDSAGFESEARRLRYRWLYTIVKNAASYHGTVPEKFDVVARSHAVFQEYGNVNTEFSYIADEGFGWMNASFIVGWRALDPELRESLKKLVPPEHLFGGR